MKKTIYALLLTAGLALFACKSSFAYTLDDANHQTEQLSKMFPSVDTNVAILPDFSYDVSTPVVELPSADSYITPKEAKAKNTYKGLMVLQRLL
jgi:hypothetical protein